MKDFSKLPEKVQDRIKFYLKVYNEIDVYYENGTYHFGSYVKEHYNNDFKYIGKFKVTDFYKGVKSMKDFETIPQLELLEYARETIRAQYVNALNRYIDFKTKISRARLDKLRKQLDEIDDRIDDLRKQIKAGI